MFERKSTQIILNNSKIHKQKVDKLCLELRGILLFKE